MQTSNRLVTQLQAIFYSPSEKRFRAGWRVLLQLILLGLFVCIISFPVFWFSVGQSSTWIMGFFTLAGCFEITVSVFYARRYIDKRSFVSLGISLKGLWIKDIAAGVGISFLMVGLMFAIGNVLNWIKIDGMAWTNDGIANSFVQTTTWLVIFIMIAWQEELLARGYQLQNISEGLNIYWGAILSSILFSFFHLSNPGANWPSMLGVFLAGLMLSVGYIYTKQLWLPIGIHLGWNFFEGVLFGFPVSGMQTYALTKINLTGPELWIGGKFGPEAGLLLLPALAFGVLLIFSYSKIRVKND